MKLTERRRQQLAATLARKFPDWSHRERIVSQAGLTDAQIAGDPLGSWSLVIGDAAARDLLVKLLEAAARAEPTDAELARLAGAAARGELDDGDEGAPKVPVAVMAGAGLLGVALVVVAVFAFQKEEQATPDVGSVAELARPADLPVEPSEPAPDAAPASEMPARAAPAEPTATVAPVPAALEAQPSDAEPAADAVSAAPAAKAVVIPVAEGPCAGAVRQDGRVGYAYAGADAPVLTDGVWTVSESLNVRVDYPGAHNGFDARARVACVVPAGGAVEVAGEPVRVPGGAYWVPVRDVRAR